MPRQPGGRQPGGRQPDGRQPASASATITGTSLSEEQLVLGGQVITATLADEAFAAAGTGPVGSIADTQALIDGIVSAQSEINGFNAERSNIAVTDIARVSDTVVTLTLPPLASYQITANETITWTVPAQAVAGGLSLVGSPTIGILSEAPLTAVVGPHFAGKSRKRRKRRDDDRAQIRILIEEAAGIIKKVEKIKESAPEPKVVSIKRKAFKSQLSGLRSEMNAIKSEISRMPKKIVKQAKIEQVDYVLDDVIQEIMGGG